MGFFTSLHQFSDLALLILRLALGTVFLFHGLPKKGLWSAQPSAQMPAGMLRNLRILSIAEPAGALGLIFGFLTQLAGLGLVIVMLGAITFLTTKVHRKFKEANAPGWEFEFMLLVGALVLAILGGGKYALDRVIFGI
ncbi:MAG TPA: DoxX family protein [Gemmatimonadales bacterium]|nr:DoxX family protein [Gemmatimonadales bacterium]